MVILNIIVVLVIVQVFKPSCYKEVYQDRV